MEQIHKLILGLLPVEACNFRCEYCYITQLHGWKKPQKMTKSPQFIAKALSKKRLGGTSLINLTGNGETLLQPEIVDITKELLKEGHYVEIVTNCSVTKRVDEILSIDKNLLKHLFFKISFHYKELCRLGLLDQFFENVKKIMNSNASFTLELMAYDGIENDIDDIISVCKDNVGAVCQSTIGRNENKRASLLSSHSKEDFYKIWSRLDSPMFELKMDMVDKKRKEFCYAGAWSMFVNLYTGEARKCYGQLYYQNIYDDINKPLRFDPVGYCCTQPFCINSHAHLTWGLIPELNVPDYYTVRDRITESGEHWLKPECQEFFKTKLYDANRQYSQAEKVMNTVAKPINGVILISSIKHNRKGIQHLIERKLKFGDK